MSDMEEFFGPPISTYSRKEAIEDGMLVPTTDLVPDEPDFAKQAGWKVPVALTTTVADLCIPTERELAKGQSVKGRLWDVLNMARMYGGRDTDTVFYPCIFWVSGRDQFQGAGSRTVHLKAVIGPGDTMDPVLTIMMGNES